MTLRSRSQTSNLLKSVAHQRNTPHLKGVGDTPQKLQNDQQIFTVSVVAKSLIDLHRVWYEWI